MSEATVLAGRVWKFGDWISGDSHVLQFSDMKDFAGQQDEAWLKSLCFAEVDPRFAQEVQDGDVVVAGIGFGIPSHPPVPLALKASGVSVIVVESTDSAFVRRCLNVGLPVLICPGITDLVEAGDRVQVDLASGVVTNQSTGRSLITTPFSPRMLEILHAGGIIEYLEQNV